MTSPLNIDYKKLLGNWAREHQLDININRLLSSNKGKEAKLIVRLCKQHEKPNPLNAVFLTRLESIDATDYLALTELYLSVFYPSDLRAVDSLLKTHKGQEKELFSKLAHNFNSCNPLELPSLVDYHQILTSFFELVDPQRVSEVESCLEKCKGRETILFAVLSKEYKNSNPLNEVFISRMASIDANDYLALTKLYLQVYNPKIAYRAESLFNLYRDKHELFAKLAEKFNAINPLDCVEGRSSQAQENVPQSPCITGPGMPAQRIVA